LFGPFAVCYSCCVRTKATVWFLHHLKLDSVTFYLITCLGFCLSLIQHYRRSFHTKKINFHCQNFTERIEPPAFTFKCDILVRYKYTKARTVSQFTKNFVY
jgi:hypothetical protein